MIRFLPLALLFLLVAACTSTAETAVSPSPTATDTAVSLTENIPPPVITVETPRVELPTAVPDPTQPPPEPNDAVPTEPEPVAGEAAVADQEAVAENGVISGRTPEGAFFWGDPNAPITHIDYSDFL